MKKLIPILAFIGCLTYACSDDDDANTPCTTEVVPGLEITVTDITTDAILGEGLTVTATDGNYIEVLDYFDGTKNFYGADERAGTYTITVTGTGYQPYVSNAVTVTADRCHVVTQKISIALERDNQ